MLLSKTVPTSIGAGRTALSDAAATNYLSNHRRSKRIYLVDVSPLRCSKFSLGSFCIPCCREIVITYLQVINVMNNTVVCVHPTPRFSYYFPVSQRCMTTWFCYYPMTCDYLHVWVCTIIDLRRHCRCVQSFFVPHFNSQTLAKKFFDLMYLFSTKKLPHIFFVEKA